MSSSADFKKRFNSVFLLTQQDEKKLPILAGKIDSALQGMQKEGDSGIDLAKRIMNKDAVREAFISAGIDIEAELAKLQKRTAHPAFTIVWDAESSIDDRKRMILFTSNAPTTAVYLPHNYKKIFTIYDGFIGAKTRGEKSKFLLTIREKLFLSGKIPDGSRFIDYYLWNDFFSCISILSNVSVAYTEAKLPGLFRLDNSSMAFSGLVSNSIAMARARGKVDPMAHALNVNGLTISSDNAKKIGVGEGKLLRFAITAFTKVNAPNAKAPQQIICADTKDFAHKCKVEITPATMGNPEAQAKENKRAAKALENFIAKLKKNAFNLKDGTTFSWDERIQGKTKSFGVISLIAGYEIDEDIIKIEFSKSAADYLVALPLAQEPVGLYAIDDRNYNAFSIAVNMNQHYSIENNVIRNTETILSIPTIIGYTSLPSYEEVREQENSWWARIKEPFEKALDELTRSGFLKNWHYCHAGKIALTDREVEALTRYEQFASLYVCFELAGYSSHEERAVTIKKKRDEGRTKNKGKVKQNKEKKG